MIANINRLQSRTRSALHAPGDPIESTVSSSKSAARFRRDRPQTWAITPSCHKVGTAANGPSLSAVAAVQWRLSPTADMLNARACCYSTSASGMKRRRSDRPQSGGSRHRRCPTLRPPGGAGRRPQLQAARKLCLSRLLGSSLTRRLERRAMQPGIQTLRHRCRKPVIYGVSDECRTQSDPSLRVSRPASVERS